jgi:lysophospholipase L1-like esterase
VILLAVSLCANVLLGRSLLSAFERLQLARIFPLGFAPDERPRSSHLAASDSIAFWGDSRAYFWDTDALARDHAIENLAHGGQSSGQLLLQLQTTPVAHATYAVVQIGINDLHPLGVLAARKAQIVAGLRANITAIRDALLARSDRVILTTIFPPGRVPLERRLMWDPQTPALIEQTNRAIRAAADGNRVLVLDANALLRNQSGWLATAYADPDFFLHVNRTAYSRLNAELERMLDAHR